MRKFISGILVGILISMTVVAFSSDGIYTGKITYVKAEQENLRNKPSGVIIGNLKKGAPMQVLEVQDQWLRVAAVGYIWRESVTGDDRALRTDGFRAAMILVKTQEEAQAVLAQLKGGADFGEIAKAKSIGPKKEQGGDLGEAFPGEFDPTFERAILSLQVGEISDIIQTSHGYHIFKRLK